MRIIRFTVVLMLTGWLCFSGTDRDFEKDAVKISGEAFIKNNTCRIIKMLSDEIGPRVTGSEPAHRAALMCLDLLKKYGLSNANLEFFNFDSV